MTTAELEKYFGGILDIGGFASADSSLNGIQVDNDGADVRKVLFAVDATLEIFHRAAASGAGLVVVHHGLFWGNPLALRGVHRERIRFLVSRNIALYAVHLPLDQHPEIGNNAALAELLDLEELQPFGLYHGKKIGYKGRLREPLTVEDAVRRISFMNRPPVGVYPFGKRLSQTCAVVSGGAAMEAFQAMEEGVDLFVTGESSHSVYHQALEGQLNMIAGGHYSTEVWGIRRLMVRCAEDTSLDVEFYDAPSGL